MATFWHASKSIVSFRPDIIHVHTSYVLPIGLLLKVVSRRPVVHLVPSLFSQMRDQGKGWVPRLYSRFHSLFDCFFVAAYRCRDELLSVGVPEEKVFPFYGLLDLQAIDEVRIDKQEYYTKIREAAHLPADALIVLSVGRLDPSKGHNFSLQALPALVRRFPNLHWVVLGDGKQREELEARAKELDVLTHVHLVGHKNKPLPYYAAANVYLRSMIFEETNLSTYQAMAMGLPMVGFDTACETELLIRVGHGILVPNQSVEALIAGVTEILSLPDHGRGMGSRRIQFSQANLDIRRAIGGMTMVYKNLKNGFDPRKAIPVK